MAVWCDKCKRDVPWQEVNSHKHKLGIKIISDDHPLARDSDILPLHERYRISLLSPRRSTAPSIISRSADRRWVAPRGLVIVSSTLATLGILLDTLGTAYVVYQLGIAGEANVFTALLLNSSLAVWYLVNLLQVAAIASIGYYLYTRKTRFGYWITLAMAGLGAWRAIGGLSNILLLFGLPTPRNA